MASNQIPMKEKNKKKRSYTAQVIEESTHSDSTIEVDIGLRRENVKVAELLSHFMQHNHCLRFCPDEKDRKKCQCGRTADKHTPRGSTGISDVWRTDTHCSKDKNVDFGSVHFPGKGIGKSSTAVYLRLSSLSQPNYAMKFMQAILTKQYGYYFTEPVLLLSVTGGAKAFNLSPRLKSVIKRGITKAVEKTDAWIVTGGTHSGVMQLVGEIMGDVKKENHAPVIGVATWGVVDKRETLSETSLDKRLDVEYTSSMYKALDRNHNFFFLVDDGKDEVFGGEIEFRSALEKAIATEYKIPAVTLVIQGGPGTLKTAHDAVEADTPIVVIEGSGQAADLLAYAWNLLHGESLKARNYTVEDLSHQIKKNFANLSSKEVKDYLKMILETVELSHKVVIYSLSEYGGKDIDEAILKAVFKGSESKLTGKLRQAMYWDRIEFARAALQEFSGKSDSAEFRDTLNENLMWSLSMNKPDFVELYLEHGASVSDLQPTKEKIDFVDVEQQQKKGVPNMYIAMEQLYARAARHPHSHVRYLVHPKKRNLTGAYSLENMEAIMQSLVDDSFNINRDKSLFTRDSKDLQPMEKKLKESTAYHMLLVWAVTLDKFRMAQMFWLRGGQSVPNALVAARMLDSMSKSKWLSHVHLADERSKMEYNSHKFEKLAVGVLEKCQATDADLTELMLHSHIPQFKNMNCIEVAHQAYNLEFMSQPATQAVVNKDWYGGMSTGTQWYQIVLCLAAPILIPIIIWFNNEQPKQTTRMSRSIRQILMEDDEKNKGSRDFQRPNLSIFRMFYLFYKAPLTRFWIDLIAHMSLLVLFSYMTLDSFKDELSALEIIIIIWFASLLLEEIRQMIMSGFLNWVDDVWNRLDGLLIMVYIAGIIVRVINLKDDTFQTNAKAIFGINCIFLFLRFMRYYAVSSNLGPKLIMMRRMLNDVMAFVALLLIFLMGYGIASQALLYPSREFDRQSFTNIFFRPYFQIYGELFLDEIQADSDCIGPWQFSSCGGKSAWIIPFLLALYILIANILLINLLIAMFNDTYTKVQEQSNQYWNMLNFELYEEYKSRPLLPGPFLVLNHIFLIFYSFFFGCCKRDSLFNRPAVLDKLEAFQENATDAFMSEQNKEAENTDSARIERNSEHIEELVNEVHSLLENNHLLRQMIERQNLSVNIALNPDKVESSSDGTKTLTRKASRLITTTEAYRPPVEYPDKKRTRRFEVPPNKILWTAAYPEYEKNVVELTDPSVKGDWADPPECHELRFNQVDGKINRVSFLGVYQLDNFLGRPLNPRGRTGISGRGILGKWGPNHAVDPIVTRWKRTEDGGVFERNGKRVLEFVCIKRRDNNMWALPGGFVDAGETVTASLIREFKEEALDALDRKPDEDVETTLKNLFGSGHTIAEVYSNDPRNTDNAWIETTAVHFHDDTGKGVSRFELHGGDDANAARWRMVHRGLDLFASHYEFMQSVAYMLDAYW